MTMLDPLPLVLTVLLAPQAPSPDVSALRAELDRLQSEVAALEARARQRDEALDAMKGALKAVETGVTELRSRPAVPPSGPFMSAPPASSDAVGVAKTVVFAPRIEVDTLKRRDLVSLKVRRVEASGVQLIAEKELASEEGIDLPIDQSGALYIVDWSTTEGQTYNLILRDGASGQTAATAQVRLQQTQGKFIFVGYRAE
ncbi:MAG: hypothetical protein DMF80_07270 [Acidobacteria bacterium]|nr:MAG: hypothetical protein DMF80_07270 [Acidobacteriota bacterium]PYQ17734.1 MAG: hypothetical protein DMF81_27000 [Acidobacteriota bacterium]